MKQYKYLVLDHGFVEVDRIVDTDEDIVRRARISTEKQYKNFQGTKNFIRYLLVNGHTSPFDFPKICLKFCMPKFVREQMFRHRTALKLENDETIEVTTTDNKALAYHAQQEFSGRYAIYEPAVYVPPVKAITYPSQTNKQSRTKRIMENAESIHAIHQVAADQDIKIYSELLELGEAKELARINLPVALYTEFYWEQSLKNMLDWLRLRRSEDAQWEIRAYADVVEKIIEEHFPYTYKAWLDLVEGVYLTKNELDQLNEVLRTVIIDEKLRKRLNNK